MIDHEEADIYAPRLKAASHAWHGLHDRPPVDFLDSVSFWPWLKVIINTRGVFKWSQ